MRAWVEHKAERTHSPARRGTAQRGAAQRGAATSDAGFSTLLGNKRGANSSTGDAEVFPSPPDIVASELPVLEGAGGKAAQTNRSVLIERYIDEIGRFTNARKERRSAHVHPRDEAEREARLSQAIMKAREDSQNQSASNIRAMADALRQFGDDEAAVAARIDYRASPEAEFDRVNTEYGVAMYHALAATTTVAACELSADDDENRLTGPALDSARAQSESRITQAQAAKDEHRAALAHVRSRRRSLEVEQLIAAGVPAAEAPNLAMTMDVFFEREAFSDLSDGEDL